MTRPRGLSATILNDLLCHDGIAPPQEICVPTASKQTSPSGARYDDGIRFLLIAELREEEREAVLAAVFDECRKARERKYSLLWAGLS